MKHAIKTKWIKDLTSGEYVQGIGGLRSNLLDPGETSPVVQHCCLGVLTDQAVKAGVITWEQVAAEGWGVLPTPVAEWAGLDDSDPVVPNVVEGLTWKFGSISMMAEPGDEVRTAHLSTYNDSTEATFAQIALIIAAGIPSEGDDG